MEECAIRDEKGFNFGDNNEKGYKIKEYKGVASGLVRALPVGCRLNLTKFQAATNRSS